VQARTLEQGESHPIGFALVLAGVVDLVLDLQRSAAATAASVTWPLCEAAARGKYGGARAASDVHCATLPVQHARLVALQDARSRGDHAGELRTRSG
jgi:hypothetical protein